MNGVKQEEYKVKPEPGSPSRLIDEDDIDLDEDTGELKMPPESEDARGWLTQIPRELWTALSTITESREFANLNEDDPINLGEIKVWMQPDHTQVVRMVFKDRKGWDTIPKEYDVDVNINQTPKNMFIFTEKNTPGFKPGMNMGMSKKREDRDRKPMGGRFGAGSRIDKQRRGPRTVPKHTSLYGVPVHEARATPRENEEWHRIQIQKVAALEKKVQESSILDGLSVRDSHSMIVGARDLGQKSSWTGLTTKSAQVKKPRAQDNKAARIPETELMDQLFKLYSGDFQFFPMKVLKQRTRQPEAYLREVLSKIGRLVKTGPAANTWALRPEWAATKSADWASMVGNKDENNADAADIAATDSDGDDDGDDFDDDMEDVL